MRPAASVGAGAPQLIPLAIVLGSLSILMFAVVTDLPVAPAAAAVVLLTGAAVWSRTALAWTTLLAAVVLVILLIPVRRYTMPGNLPFELEPYRLLVAIVAGCWLACLLVDPRVRLRRSILDGPLLLIVASAVASILANGGRIHELAVSSTVSKKLTFLLSFLLVFYLFVSVIRRRVELDRLVKVLVAGTILVAGLALLEARTHYNVFNDLGAVIPILELNEVLTESDLGRGGQLRVYASAQHPIALGALFVLVIPMSVYLAIRTGARRWWLGTAVLALGTVATLSRTGILMLLAVALVFLWLRTKETRKLWPLLIPLVLVVHLALPGAIGTLRSTFFPSGGLIQEQRQGAGSVGSGRVADLRPSLDEASRQPLFGYGYGTRVVDGPTPNAPILDNQWLATLLETGLLGVAGWLWIVVRFIRRMKAAARWDDSDLGWLYTGLAASAAAFGVGMFTFDALSFIQATFVFFILLSFGVAALDHGDDATRRSAPA
jgi:hypothetical protein